MSGITVQLKGTGIDTLRRVCEGYPGLIRKEMAMAVNKTAKFHGGQIAKSITQEIAINQKGAKESLRYNARATAANIEASVTVKKEFRPSLKRFKAKQTKKGVSYRIKKGGKTQLVPGAFGPNIPRLGNHAYKRAGKKRFPITKLRGPSVWGVYVKNNLVDRSTGQLHERLQYEAERRVRAVIRRLSRK